MSEFGWLGKAGADKRKFAACALLGRATLCLTSERTVALGQRRFASRRTQRARLIGGVCALTKRPFIAGCCMQLIQRTFYLLRMLGHSISCLVLINIDTARATHRRDRH